MGGVGEIKSWLVHCMCKYCILPNYFFGLVCGLIEKYQGLSWRISDPMEVW